MLLRKVVRLLKILSINALVLLILLAGLELTLRLVDPQNLPTPAIGSHEWRDDYKRPTPAYDETISFPERKVRWTINAQGLRDHEFDSIKAPGLVRIIGFGDSYTFGYTVEQEQTFLHHLESLMNAERARRCPDSARMFQTLNMGVVDCGTINQFRYARGRGMAYQPDLLLLAVYPGNDVYDVLAEHKKPGAPDPGAAAAGTRANPLLSFFRYHSHLYAFVSERLHTLLLRFGLRQVDTSSIEVLRKTESAKVRQGWNLLESHIMRFDSLAAAHDAELLVLLLPTRHQVRQSEWDFIRATYKLSADDFQIDRAQRRLSDFCAAANIACLDALPALRRDSLAAFNPNRDRHLSPRGHWLVADTLFRFLRPRLCGSAWTPSP